MAKKNKAPKGNVIIIADMERMASASMTATRRSVRASTGKHVSGKDYFFPLFICQGKSCLQLYAQTHLWRKYESRILVPQG